MPDNPNKLTRVDPTLDYPIPGDQWNKAANLIEASQIEVAPPLEIIENAAGPKMIRLAGGGVVVSLKLTATEGQGLFTARAYMGSVRGLPGTSGAVLPSGLIDPGFDNALAIDPGAAWAGTNGGTVMFATAPTTASPIGATGVLVGVTNETPPRGVYELAGGGLPQAQYENEYLMSRADHSAGYSLARISESNELP